MKSNTSYIIKVLILIAIYCNSVNAVKLKGVTVEVTPYVYVMNNEFYGYCVDVMNAIAEISGFNYSLYKAPDGKHGEVSPTGAINGIMSEVYYGAADFGLASLTASETRKRYVDFSKPIMNLSVSALIHTTNAEYIETFRDLPRQTRITYGTTRRSRMQDRFYNRRNDGTKDYIQTMYDAMRLGNTFVANTTEGIRRAKVTKFAFIQESVANEFIAANDCDLVSIRDYNKYFNSEYAIAVPKGSPYLAKINYAISQLEAKGLFSRLKAKYWKSQCNSTAATFRFNSFVLLFIAMFLSCVFI